MDPIMIVVGAVIVFAIVAYAFASKDKTDLSDKPMPSAAQQPVKKAEPKPAEAAVTPTKPKKAVSKRVQALKSEDAVKPSAAPKAKPLPTKTTLLKMTKEKIEETARSYGIELDKRMTKNNMVQTFLAEAQAAAKAKK